MNKKEVEMYCLKSEYARLLAVNADLLAALEAMVAEFGDYHIPTKPCVTQARAALARATGKA